MERKLTSWNVSKALELLCQKDRFCAEKLLQFSKNKKWKPNERQLFLCEVSNLFLQTQCTASICCYLRPFILDIVERIKSSLVKKDAQVNVLKFTVALSIGVRICPDLKGFVLQFLKEYKPYLSVIDSEPRKKKSKHEEIPEILVCESIYYLLQILASDIYDYIDIQKMINNLSSNDTAVRWYSALNVCILLNMSGKEKEMFLRKYFTVEEEHELLIRDFTKEEKFRSKYLKYDDLITIEESSKSEVSRTPQHIITTDLSSSVTDVCGVLLSKSVGCEKEYTSSMLVPVQSMVNNLRSLALAVASGSPVLLQGPVGCGKTCIVEHLGHLTSRHCPPELIKIQLGDQTDSKALLGIYRCTEVPGEFVWQPGILTQAVTNGYWVLLEDIDYASMDVISILLPLLENHTLSVPGHGDNIKASPNFRLFATQRLISSVGGWQKQQSSSSILLEKMWTKIHIEPLSRSELAQVIITRYPILQSIVQRILDVYFLLSVGKHDIDMDIDTLQMDSTGKFTSIDGRLISTRDLMTWCKRISVDFVIQSTATANRVFEEACDCFISCISKADKRLCVAEAIGGILNINKDTADYYCNKYKPTINITPSLINVGRVSLPKKVSSQTQLSRTYSTFSFTRLSVSLLEKVGVCIIRNEPVLLVGETGTGKTSSVQFLAQQLGHKLHVVNMNQQSDSSDLLGGYKPVDIKFLIMPFREEFEMLFCKSFSRKQNAKFLGHVQDCFSRRKWSDLLKLIQHTTSSALNKFVNDNALLSKWRNIDKRVQQLQIQIKQTENVLAFTFIEGTLVKAIKEGDWVLLDEINLASTETLECLCGLLENTSGSIILTDRGDIEPIIRHENFRLFACMNPATDVGKKDLTPGVRNRFIEFYVEELTDESDLRILISDYLSGLALTANHITGIVQFYSNVRKIAEKKLVDGTGHKPHYSLRTLCRALRYAGSNPCGQASRSLYEGFCLSFLTQLDRTSHPIVEHLVCKHVIGNSNIKSMLNHALPQPRDGQYLQFEGYWIAQGSFEAVVPEDYILTPSVRANLKDLARIVSAGEHPVLLQGETSVGKTSLIYWLAKSSGNVCVRVNNHEHTDLQEYVGCYAADDTGKLVFKEGILVEAMRKGHWIILDELNLAPTDVLEALNRLLDDNRELFIPETQITVKAHPKFMLFATQNPAGQYGGRKILSRAFRNRFIELHFDEIPSVELETILHLRCSIPHSYSKRLVAVMLDLQTRRRSSGVFAGKQGFMTLRDLFRWAERYNTPDDKAPSNKYYDWDQHLADHGYMLLAGRVRKPEECQVIQDVLHKHFKRKVDPERLFNSNAQTSPLTSSLLDSVLNQSLDSFQHIVWTYSMRRLAVLIGQALKFKEPILLVGETGCGKTTICQLYAALKQSELYSVNCHLHTEGADFLGGLRPVRSHSDEPEDKFKLFEWVDGPLVLAMKESAMFLIDEISLADDSVLERLNSVLEPERKLLLAEKGGGDGAKNESEEITAGEEFRIFATMNPGGDFGKKELSPALRNRFTEIWCPPCNLRGDMIDIIEHNIQYGIYLSNQQDGTTGIGPAIMDFIEWFTNNEVGRRCTVSIRDILSWVQFINICSIRDDNISDNGGTLPAAISYIHGACLVFLDGLGSGLTSNTSGFSPAVCKQACLEYLLKQINSYTSHTYTLDDVGLSTKQLEISYTTNTFTISLFTINKGCEESTSYAKYALKAPTTGLNAVRILRGLQLSRPLLLEGCPGVGKTSLVTAIAAHTGHKLIRINLSEQTDISDLFGADLPVEGEKGGTFAWRDGPLLQALKSGHWVVLDELNLASQSVLEGLNACLDHRGEVYIPELGKTFQIKHNETRIFACQNPLHQGGGRKGLPRSFLNRFTQVYIEPLEREDLLFITQSIYSTLPSELLSNMVDFNMNMYNETVIKREWGSKGGPWEFNLRDLFRWCDLLLTNQIENDYKPGEYVGIIYSERLRNLADRNKVYDLFTRYFNEEKFHRSLPILSVNQDTIQVGHSFISRLTTITKPSLLNTGLQILHRNLHPLQSIIKCIEMNWMTILVGPQASGKTSIIRLLSELTGNQLHVLPMNSSMDTTELLGGFEQTDVYRHLEEVSGEVEGLLRRYQKSILTSKQILNYKTVLKLQQLWLDYSSLQLTGDKTSSVEEYNLMLKCIQSLNHILQYLSSLSATELHGEIEDIKERIKTLNKTVIQCEPGKGGGEFEWVDSLLIKSLQAGHWLLIDNVNFCSASVLDRLNALLEPGGVLSINERGVIDGQIPSITPHINFRLFLAMDPKHGEISRAMRNRGVEIYIPGESDHYVYSQLDILSMLSAIPLNDRKLCDCLLNIHDEIKTSLPYSEKPTINDLLRCGVVVKQQLDRGLSIVTALKEATFDVYVKCLKMKQTKQIASGIINDNITSIEARPDNLNHVKMWNGSKELNKNITLYNTGQASASLSHYITKYIRLFKNKEVITESNIDEMIHSVSTALSIFISNASFKDWKFTESWFKIFINLSRTFTDLTKGQYGYSFSQFVSELPSLCSQILQVIFDSNNSQHQIQVLSTLCQDNSKCTDMLLQEPWDMSTNKQLLHKIKLYIGSDKKFDTNVDILLHHIYKLYMLVDVNLVMTKCRKWTEFLGEQSVKVLSLPSSPLYILVHIHNLISNLQMLMMSTVCDQDNNMSLKQFSDNLPCLVYFLSVIYNVKRHPETLFLSRLSVHWNWFYNKLLVPLLSSTSPSFRVPSVIQSTINQLQNVMGEENISAKQFIKYLKLYGHPKAFTSRSHAELQKDIRLCSDSLNIHTSCDVKTLKLKVDSILTDGDNLHKQLLSIYEALIEDTDNDLVHDRIQSLRCIIISKGILEEEFESMETNDTDEKKLTTKKQVIELWPVYEHLAVLCEYSTMTSTRNLDIDILKDYIISRTPSTPTHLLYIDKLPPKEVHIKLNTVVLDKLWSCSVSNNVNMWLNWNSPLDSTTENIKHRNRGPGMFHLLPISYPLYSILSSKTVNPKDNGYLPLYVPLGGIQEQLYKLRQISSHLWTCSSILSSPSFDIRYMERNQLLISFVKMLECLQCLVPDKMQQDWQTQILDLKSNCEHLTCDDIRSVHILYQQLIPNISHCSTPIISRCFEILMDVLQSTEINVDDVGLGLSYVGLAGVYLLAPVGPVDPVEKQSIKLNNYQQTLKEVEIDIKVYEKELMLKYGVKIQDVENSNLHIRLQYLLNRRTELIDKINKLQQHQAYRPDPLQFQSLIHDVKAYLESIGSVERVTSLLSKLQTAKHNKHGDNIIITSGLREEEAWQLSQASFLKNLDRNYWCYCDIIIPFSVSVQQMRTGISILAQSVETKQKKSSISKGVYNQTLDDVLLVLSQFPNVSKEYTTFHDLTKCLIYDTTCDLVNASISVPEDQTYTILSKLLLCGLYLIKVHCQHKQELTTDITQTLSNLFGAFVSAWQDQEIRRKQKEEENASLYKYRSKTHGDDKTQEEKDEEDFKSSYPSFEKDYGDLIEAQRLEDVGMEEDDDEDVGIKSSPNSITINEMYTVYKIHHLLFTSLTSSHWLAKKTCDKPLSHDYLQPIMLAYSIASQVATKSLGALGHDVDVGVLGSHLLISGIIQQTVLSSLNSDVTQSDLCIKQSEFYDIYYDSNVYEVNQCKELLDKFTIRIDELLVQFPHHPTLKQITSVINRILSFSITSPIMKFLVGLELLLEQTKDWEANAAEHVSVMVNFKEITTLVVQWRKLELGCWKNALLLEERKCEQSVSKWWFHIYQLITSYLFTDDSNEDAVNVDALVKSLKEFLEKSNLGEFKCRVNMILAFHCQVYNMDPSDRQADVLNLLWNLYQFYSQYLPNIETEITSQKAPLQKELKGFVKIARWSDLNYWALKQSTEKTHRTVHKYSKRYQVILNQPVTKLLGEKGDNLSIITSGVKSNGSVLCNTLEEYRQNILTGTIKLNTSDLISDVQNITTLQTRLPVIIPRVSKHWKTLVRSLNYTDLLTNLDEFTGDVIENVHELQQSEVPQGDDKDKQKSDAKFLNLRKRKSLSELFKYLTKMGLSYRKGLILDDTTKQDDNLLLQPLDVLPASHQYNLSTVLSSQWEGCQKYFYTCITRKSQLQQAVVQPAQDLGLGNVERCRGFSQHLHHIFTLQRHELEESFTSFLIIRRFMFDISRLKGETTLPSQPHFKYWLDKIKNLLLQIMEGLNQFQLLLQCCPSSHNNSISPLSPSQLSNMAHVKKDDTLWKTCFDDVQNIIDTSQQEYNRLLKLSDTHILIREDLLAVEESCDSINNFCEKLMSLSKLFNDPTSNTSCSFNEPLNILIDSITSSVGEFKQWVDNNKSTIPLQSGDISSNIVSSIDDLIESILLVVQKLLSRHPVTSDTKEDKGDEEDELKDKYIVNGLIEELKSDITELKAKKISKLLEDIVNKILQLFDNTESIEEGRNLLCLLYRCLPLLQRYYDICEYYIAHVISSHRCTGKLLSVLLAIFTELSMKGFCVPPELSDEMEKEGASEFKDIEQGGLGDGEGVKDVSDQIETEDQLDEARKAGEEKNEEENDNTVPSEDNAIEMSEDFDGKPQDREEDGKDDDADDSNNDDDEDDIDKQMGDVDEQDTDKLDEQLWGSDEEDEKNDEPPKEDDSGTGDGETESELVAKDNTVDEGKDKQQPDKDNKQDNDEQVDDEINEQQDIEEEGYNDDKIDPNQGDSKEPEPQPEAMQLPEELNLDDDEAGGKDDEEKETEDINNEGDMDDSAIDDTNDVKDDDIKDDDIKEDDQKDDDQKEDDQKDKDGNDEDNPKEEESKEVKTGEEIDEKDTDRQDEEGQGQDGFTAEDENADKEDDEEKSENIEASGKTTHDQPNIEHSDNAQSDINQTDNNQQEKVGSGMADTQQDEGHEGAKSSETTQGSNDNMQESIRQPGKCKEDRSLGVPDQSYQRLKTTDESSSMEQEEEQNDSKKQGDIYEHIKDSTQHYDTQTLDVATEEQLKQQAIMHQDEEQKNEDKEDMTNDIKPLDEENQEEDTKIEQKESNKVKSKKMTEGTNEDVQMKDAMEEERETVEIPGERILTMTVGRGPESTIHTALEHLYLHNTSSEDIDIEKIRAELEDNVNIWSNQSMSTPEQIAEASSAWQKYEAVTTSLSQELCEQLRLILEPSQATKLKGDYRTGKRLNMRKVIPYIASQFRKDKIWLRRSKPSKRQYQIMLAIDDSSSMLDNHSKQLAFESLALIANSLTLLEAGDISVCSFGESVKVLHPFTEQFSSQSGANILHQFTFEQKKTKIAQLLQQATSVMMESRSRQHGIHGNPETSQLLLIVSDGRGLFSEGMETVKTSVRKAREANIFLVFVIIDNPNNKDSILDIRFPIFKDLGKLPEIRNYMEEFPFPFYVILRDINSLPIILSDALRQWFELVTASDR